MFGFGSDSILRSADWLSLLSIVSVGSTVGLFLCGIPICRKIIQRKSSDGISAVPFLLCSISTVFWTVYGILKHDNTIVTVNSIGFVLEATYSVIFYAYTTSRKALNRQLLFIGVSSLMLLWYIYSYMDITPEAVLRQLGYICVTLNIANLGSPLASLKDVLRSKSTENLPRPLCLANFIVSCLWLLYGLAVNDRNIVFPNTVGIGLSLLQLSLFVLYPKRPTTRHIAHKV